MITAHERELALELIARACCAGARKQAACAALGISVRASERWAKAKILHDKRQLIQRIPKNKLSPEQRANIIATANSEIYKDLPPSKIVPLLADTGVYLASESTFYRILRTAKQLTHRLPTKPALHHRPNPYTAYAPNQVWSWDITYCPSKIKGLYFYLYMIVDVFSRKITGFSVHEQESSIHASNLIQQACIDENITKDQLVLHSDNGGPMKGYTMLASLEKLGVIPSFSRPAMSDDNPYSESLFKTLKYQARFPITEYFSSVLEAREWAIQLVDWYNNQHLHSALKFVTPQQRHTGEDMLIRAKRQLVYEQAKAQHPERWSRQTRDWSLPNSITLNPRAGRKSSMPADAHNVNDATNLADLCHKLNKLSEQECLDGMGYDSRQTAAAVR